MTKLNNVMVVLGLGLTAIIWAFGCSSTSDPDMQLRAEQKPGTERDAQMPLDSSDEFEITLAKLAYERLLRQVIPIDSIVLLSDKTSGFQLRKFPNSVSSRLSEAYLQAGKNVDELRGPYDVYAKIIPVTVKTHSSEILENYRRENPKVLGLLELSRVGITYAAGPSRHFKRDPDEMLVCTSFLKSVEAEPRIYCLQTVYDGESNVFNDRLYELTQKGQWRAG